MATTRITVSPPLSSDMLSGSNKNVYFTLLLRLALNIMVKICPGSNRESRHKKATKKAILAVVEAFLYADCIELTLVQIIYIRRKSQFVQQNILS